MRLGCKVGVQFGQQGIDLHAVLPGFGHQRIADYALVRGVGVDRTDGGGIEGSDLGADGGGDRWLLLRQVREALLQALPGGIGVALGQGQQADREIGHPVAQVGEGVLHLLGGADFANQPIRLQRRFRRAVQGAAEIQVRSDCHRDQRDRQQDQPRADREAVEQEHASGTAGC